MAWRIAKSLLKLREQVNARWPNRRKDSDGAIGDAAHASRSSDHNPWVKDGATGVVTAIDITHDPASGCDTYVLAEVLRAGRDPRLKYVISNGRIFAGSAGPSPWVWRKYTGSNKHAHHMHISVKSSKGQYDSATAWAIGVSPALPAAPVPYVTPPPTIRRGSTGSWVVKLQGLLGISADGIFGPQTDGNVRAYQKSHRLAVDGIVGPATWGALTKGEN